MVEINVRIEQGKVGENLTELEKRVRNIKPALTEIGEYILLATDQRYEFQIAPDGTPWKKNSAYTLRLKRERGQILKILQATGRMRQSYKYQVTEDSVKVTNTLERARKHQLGIDVPQRVHLGISDVDQREIVEIIKRQIFKGSSSIK